MATHLVTGYAGKAHIKSEDQGSFNASFFGTGQFVMEAGNQVVASIIDNNTVRILDGDILMKGRHIRIETNTYEDITIENGTTGVNRCDLIVMEYSKNADTGIETAVPKVLKGTETSGTAKVPYYTDGDILGGATLNQMPLYEVRLNGVVLKEIAPVFTIIPTYKTLAEQYKAKFQEAVVETNKNLEAENEKIKEEIATERARIDNLTKMEEGSTTGDAELADIRVGYGGETYESAGSAVREQCRELYNQLTELKTYITDDLLGGAS